MLVFKLIFLASFVAGSYCSLWISAECYEMSDKECGEYDPRDRGQPETVQDLKDFCTDLISRLQCTLRVLEKCAKLDIRDTEKDVENYRKAVRFVESSCEEDSPVFKAVADHLECVVSTLSTMDDLCQFGDLNDTLRDQIRNANSEMCHIDAWNFYCANAKFDVNCGREVRDAINEIQVHTDHADCRQRRNQYSYYEDAFKGEFSQGKSGGDAFPGVLEAISSARSSSDRLQIIKRRSILI